MSKNRNGNPWSYGVQFHETILQPYDNLRMLTEEEYGALASFYILHSPCKGLSSQEISFEERGWTGNISTNGLGAALDKLRVTHGGKFLLPSKQPPVRIPETSSYMGMLFHYANLNDGYLSDLQTERVVASCGGGSNAWLRLFRRIRNCLAHGNFRIVEIDDGLGPSIIMEDKTTGDKRSYTARMLFRLETLMRWKGYIEAGPTGSARFISNLSIKRSPQ